MTDENRGFSSFLRASVFRRYPTLLFSVGDREHWGRRFRATAALARPPKPQWRKIGSRNHFNHESGGFSPANGSVQLPITERALGICITWWVAAAKAGVVDPTVPSTKR